MGTCDKSRRTLVRAVASADALAVQANASAAAPKPRNPRLSGSVSGRDVSAGTELVVAELPGRAGTARQYPLTAIDEIVDRLTTEIDTSDPVPLSLAGHSFGSIVAYELARALPIGLVKSLSVSAMRAPHIHAQRPFVHTMDDDRLLIALERLGGMPPSLRSVIGTDLASSVLRSVRADFEALETYRAAPEPRLACPMTVLGATDDPAVPPEVLYSWQGVPAEAPTFHLFTGGHFFVFDPRNLGSLVQLVERGETPPLVSTDGEGVDQP